MSDDYGTVELALNFAKILFEVLARVSVKFKVSEAPIVSVDQESIWYLFSDHSGYGCEFIFNGDVF